MARAQKLNSKAGYTCAVVPQSRSGEMLAKREESIYGFVDRQSIIALNAVRQ